MARSTLAAAGWLLLSVAGAAMAGCTDDDDDERRDADAGAGGGGGGSSATGGRSSTGGRSGTGGMAAGGSTGGTLAAGGSSGGASPEAGVPEGGEGGLPDGCRGLELPAGQYFVAPGLCVRAVATEQGQLRQITFAPDGALIGVTVPGKVLRYRDLNGDGVFDGGAEIVEIADTGGNGNNAHLDVPGGYLYAGSPEGVKRWRYSATEDDLGPGEDVVVGQPSSGRHKYHTVHVYDGWLYVHSGSFGNADAPASPEYDTNRTVLRRFDLATFALGTPFAWPSGEIVVRGIRNMVGFTRDAAGRMYGVVNGIDDLFYRGQDVHEDNPGESVLRIEPGVAHGYPYCFTAQYIPTDGGTVPPGTQLATEIDPDAPEPFTNPHDDAWCAANSTPPVAMLRAHSAPLDITFFDGPSGNLPEEWRGGAFISLHGSWNTTPSVGHSVVFQPFRADGSTDLPAVDANGAVTFPYVPVFGGASNGAYAEGAWGWEAGGTGEDPVRPVGVAVSPVDGALYVSSDNATVLTSPDPAPQQGAIYRIALDR